MPLPSPNTLYYGDNLPILRDDVDIDLLNAAEPKLPPAIITFKQAHKVKAEGGTQTELL